MTSSSRLALGATLLAIAAATWSSAACTLLETPAQCAVDADCTRFDPSATCGPQSICVSKSTSTSGTDATPSDASSSTPTGDGGASTPLDSKCTVSPKPTANVSMGQAPGPDGGVQVAALTLDCDKDWIVDGPVVVPTGATLTIKAGTTLRAKKGVLASIIVQPGGRIVAEGQKTAPIVMTVDDPAPKAGDWRGLFVLGNAPRTGTGGYAGDALLTYGGNNPNDDSGVLTYVRVEYAQDSIVLGGVGKGTRIDSLQARFGNDNCFVLNGGSVDAKHLVCQSPVDEQFEIGDGYTGHLQFIYGQKTGPGDGHNGLLLDGAATAPVIYNATFCGAAQTQGVLGIGAVFRNGAKLDLNNTILTGWAAAIDAINAVNAPSLRSSIAFNNTANPSVEEAAATDDDNAFDENAFFRTAESGNKETDPGLMDCHNLTAPKPWAAAAIAGGRAAPGDGFFDANATFVGAFKDANDGWLGGWTRFDDK